MNVNPRCRMNLGIGVESVIADRDLALIGNMGRHPGDELQIVHPLHLGAVVAVPVADPALMLEKRQVVQGQDRPDHVLPDPLGLGLGPGPHPAMDIESRVPPGKDPLGPLRAQELLTDQKPQDFPGENLGQPHVIQSRDPMENPSPVHSPFGHQEMQVGMKVDPVPEGLDGDSQTSARSQ